MYSAHSRIQGTWSFGRLDKKGRTRGLNSIPSFQSAATTLSEMIALDLMKDDDDPLNLDFLYTSLFATILEDIIWEMRLLSECNSPLRIMKTKADIVELRAKKFSIAKPPCTDELNGIDVNDLGKEEYKLDKLAADRKIITDTLLRTYKELTLHRCFRTLAKPIQETRDREARRAILIADEAKNRLTRRELTKQLRVQRNHNTTANYDVDVVIDGLVSQVENANLNSEIRSRYITNWEISRTEQHHQWLRCKEALPYGCVVESKQKLDGEQRVHSEVMLLVHLAINETMDKVEKLMNKYDKAIEAMDLKIQIMKSNYQDARDRRMGLEAVYEEHDRQAKKWLAFKEEREHARLYEVKMTEAAIVAQAWWRGLMVRLHLGPYKPVLKRPGTAPETKKKKKK